MYLEKWAIFQGNSEPCVVGRSVTCNGWYLSDKDCDNRKLKPCTSCKDQKLTRVMTLGNKTASELEETKELPRNIKDHTKDGLVRRIEKLQRESNCMNPKIKYSIKIFDLHRESQRAKQSRSWRKMIKRKLF